MKGILPQSLGGGTFPANDRLRYKSLRPIIFHIMKTKTRTFFFLIIVLIAGGLLTTAWVKASDRRFIASLKDGPIFLSLPPATQSLGTSCGEAVIVMTYNYAYPETPLNEADVITYATENGYYSPGQEPFTSPANMLNITRNYTLDYSSGVVATPEQGLALLFRNLRNGNPTIIDVFTHLDDPTSSAHFVVVTGISVDANDPTLVTIHYNNSLTGVAESAAWEGDTGIWNAWQNNSDPGGSGWWLVINTNQ